MKSKERACNLSILIGLYLAGTIGGILGWHCLEQNAYWLFRDSNLYSIAGMCSVVFVPSILVMVIVALVSRKPKKIADHVTAAIMVGSGIALSHVLLMRHDGKYREDFALNRARWEAIAISIKSEVPAKQTFYEKPLAQKDVCSDNIVFVTNDRGNHMVFFPTLKYWIDNWSGFVYSESGEPPYPNSFLEVRHVERLDEHWFWIRTT